MVLERKDFDTDYEYLVCCMARDIYKHRKKDQMVPSGKYTWGRWFEKKFNKSYEGYTHELSNRAGKRQT